MYLDPIEGQKVGGLATRCSAAAPYLAEVPALAPTLTRFRDQCSLRQQGVYIEYIYTIVSVQSCRLSYTFIHTSKTPSHTSFYSQTTWSPTPTLPQQHLTLPAIRSLGGRPLSLNPQSCLKKPDGRSTQAEGFIRDISHHEVESSSNSRTSNLPAPSSLEA